MEHKQKRVNGTQTTQIKLMITDFFGFGAHKRRKRRNGTLHKRIRQILFVNIYFICFFRMPCAHAQQDAMYSQYMWNMLSVNPAYAGSRDAMSINLLGRMQWMSIPGAPRTQNLSIHAPTPNKRYGFGLNVVHDQISYIGQTWLTGSYALRIPLKVGTLALGLQATVNNYNINWNRAFLIDGADIVPATYGRNLWLPNAGTGVYYSTKKFYAGLAVPHLLINSLDKNRPGIYLLKSSTDQAVLKRHLFFMTGIAIPVSDNIVWKPSILIKYVHAGPLEIDLNTELLLKEKLWIGGSWRTGDGIVAMLQYQFTPMIRAGYAYDYPFTRLGRFTTGSHELMLGWDLKFKSEAAVSPRYF